MATEEYKVKITGDQKGLETALSKATAGLGRLSTTAMTVGRGLGSATKYGVAAFGALSAAVGGAVAAYKVQEQAEIKTRATIAATGKAAGLSAEEIFKMASSLQNVTTFGDEAIIGGQNLLLTFKKIGSETFPRATEVMLDMSEAMGTDLKSSAIQLGKALNDPTTGLSALSRVGITFSDQQKEMIKTMQKSGDVAGAQALILAELESQFGGVARAAAEGTGSITQTKNILGDIVEDIGKAALPFVGFLNTRIKELALSFQDTSGPLDTFKTGLSGLLKIGAFLKATFSAVGGIIGNGLATALESSKAAMDLNFKQAAMIASQGVKNVGEIVSDSAKTLEQDLADINAIGAEKKKSLRELELEKIKEDLAKEKEIRIQAEEEKAAALLEKQNSDFENQLANTLENGQILSDEEYQALQNKLKNQNLAKEMAQVKELKSKGKHDKAMQKLVEIKNKKDMVATKAKQAFDTEIANQRVGLANNTANLITQIAGKENKAAFLISQAAALAQVAIGRGKALALVPAQTASIPYPGNLAAAAQMTGYINLNAGIQAATIAAATIQGFAKGGMITGGIAGRDSVPIMAQRGEIVAPSQNYDELIESVARSRGFTDDNTEGNDLNVTITLLPESISDMVESVVIEKRALGVSTI